MARYAYGILRIEEPEEDDLCEHCYDVGIVSLADYEVPPTAWSDSHDSRSGIFSTMKLCNDCLEETDRCDCGFLHPDNLYHFLPGYDA